MKRGVKYMAYMTPYEIIVSKLNDRGETGRWLCNTLGIKYSTFTSYKGKKKIPFDVWVRSSIVLNIDLNEYKSMYDGFEPDPSILVGRDKEGI